MRRSLRGWLALLPAVLGGCTLSTFDTIMPKDAGSRQIATGVAYGDGPRRTLDIYAPAGTGKARPVIIFFYGGAWRSGTRTDYHFVGRALAARGFVAVVPDYRVVPEVRYPGFVEDGAAAVRWVEAHAAEYGGDPHRIVLAGHSAGAYIAAMLAVDDRWLGRDRAAVRGLVGLAGPYDFLPLDVDSSQAAFGAWPRPAETQPVTWAGAGDPPALLLTGDADDTVRPRNSQSLAAKLTAAGVPARVVLYPKGTHANILLSIARPLRSRAPTLEDLTSFATEVTR